MYELANIDKVACVVCSTLSHSCCHHVQDFSQSCDVSYDIVSMEVNHHLWTNCRISTEFFYLRQHRIST